MVCDSRHRSGPYNLDRRRQLASNSDENIPSLLGIEFVTENRLYRQCLNTYTILDPADYCLH